MYSYRVIELQRQRQSGGVVNSRVLEPRSYDAAEWHSDRVAELKNCRVAG